MIGGEQLALPLPEGFEPLYNIAPSTIIPTVVLRQGQLVAEAMVWGMRPHWAKSLLINARAETVLEKPTFRNAMAGRRCLIPATGFFEWQEVAGAKLPSHFFLKNHQPFAFAGLWTPNEETGFPEAVIMTTTPNELVGGIHDRMPSILVGSAMREFLAEPNPALANKMARVPFPADQMDSYMVDPRMGNPRFRGPEAIARLGG